MSINVKWEGLKEWQISEDQWREGVINSIGDEIKIIAYKIERDAKMIVPVDTGDLRKSIGTDVKGRGSSTTAEIGTDLDYSEYVEFGTSKQYAQPYLIPSFDKNITSLVNNINQILRR